MDVMPLVPETKMADVSILISLGNLLACRTTWLMLTTRSATSIFSRVFGAYPMTRILYKYFVSHHSSSLSHFYLQGQHTQSSVTANYDKQILHTLSLFTFDLQQSTATKMCAPCKYSLLCSAF